MNHDPRLALARNLVRIYRDVLQQPAPPELISLLERFEARRATGR